MSQLSPIFKFFNKLGIIHNVEKYGSITLWGILRKALQSYRIATCFRRAYKPAIVESYAFNKRRARLWRRMGCKVGENVCIGHSVSVDIGNTNLITIEEEVIITNCCILLCHKRSIRDYHMNDNAAELPYIYKPITLKKRCQIGMGTIIMPGVTVGEGAIVGARSVVTKDIPAWTVATGAPCRVIRELEPRKYDE